MTVSMSAVLVRATRRAVGLPDAVQVTATEVSDGRFDVRIPIAAAHHTGMVVMTDGGRDAAREQQYRDRAGRLASDQAGCPVAFGEAEVLARRAGCAQRVRMIVTVEYPAQVLQAVREWRTDSRRRTALDRS